MIPVLDAGASLRPRIGQRFWFFSWWAVLGLLAAGLEWGTAAESGASYNNYRIPQTPWSIHVIRWDRANAALEFHTAHAGRKAVGLGTLSDQVRFFADGAAKPVAAVNGDFYQRDKAFAGDPRGLQIMDGELISAPIGGVSFWVDAAFQPQTANVESAFRVIWANGKGTKFGLNEERGDNAVVLYTSAVGSSTKARGGKELILERTTESKQWLPLRIGQGYVARVREIRSEGDAPLTPDTMVLSIGPAAMGAMPEAKVGDVLTLSTASIPNLRGVSAAISGGPVLVRGGRRQKIAKPTSESYEFNSMFERHPRSAVGWNDRTFFLVEVDGRQKKLSVGMTLDELSDYLVKLGCLEAMNLDGGGSATLWYDGLVRNSPCDGHERDLANSLVVVRKYPPGGTNASRAK